MAEELVDIPLFDLDTQALPGLQLPPPERTLSPDARRTLRNAATLAAGRHPLGTRLHRDAAPADDRKAEGLRCGSCIHAFRKGGVAGNYTKCRAHTVTGGPGTDIRLYWPACERWEAK